MTTRVHARRPYSAAETKQVEPDPDPPSSVDVAQLAQDWLEEIDALLQENAELFVRQYRQHGGQ
jgi:Pup-like protein.